MQHFFRTNNNKKDRVKNINKITLKKRKYDYFTLPVEFSIYYVYAYANDKKNIATLIKLYNLRPKYILFPYSSFYCKIITKIKFYILFINSYVNIEKIYTNKK